MKYYFNISEEDDGFTITFPDILEAITFGTSLDEAINNAYDCLLTALEFYNNDTLPEPKTITEYFIEV